MAYTNIFSRGDFLYVRDSANGFHNSFKVDFKPTLWVTSKPKNFTGEPWHTLYNVPVYPITKNSITEYKDFVNNYRDSIEIFQPPNHVYQWIAENYPQEIEWSPDDLRVIYIDIETTVNHGRVDVQQSLEEILLITVKKGNSKDITSFGSIPVTKIPEDTTYYYSQSENTVLRDFLGWWQINYPDIISGWNCFFDTGYIYNRMVKILGDQFARKLSPWNIVNQREVPVKGLSKLVLKTTFQGIATLDYMDLYKKFGTMNQKESYALGFIAELELGETKLENPGKNFREFYENHKDLFLEYNVRDVLLVEKLDDKMKLINLAASIAYTAKVNFEDVFSVSKLWDVILYNHLNKNRQVIPIRKEMGSGENYGGGYVKDPLKGKHHWISSFDVNSEYPNIIISYNISPETLTDVRVPVTVEDLLNFTPDLSEATNQGLSVAANGCCFHKEVVGVFPFLADYYYNKRVEYKTRMIQAKKDLEKIPSHDTIALKEKQAEVAKYQALQGAIKNLIVSQYGFVGAPASRYYDVRLAEAITLTGQLTVRTLANRINGYLNKIIPGDKDRVIGIDTDGLSVCLEDLVVKHCSDKNTEQKINFMDKVSEDLIQPVINKAFSDLASYMNVYRNTMAAKRENLADVMIAVKSKHYFMNVYNSEGVKYKEPKMKIMGLSMVKSSTPAVVRNSLKNSLKVFLYGNQQQVQDYISTIQKKFNAYSHQEIAFPRGITMLNKFHSSSGIFAKGTPIHVRCALLYNHYLKAKGLTQQYSLIQEGDKIKYLYLRQPNPIHSNAIGFLDKLPSEFGLEPYIDYPTMFQKTFMDSIEHILDALGWYSCPTLDDFFN